VEQFGRLQPDAIIVDTVLKEIHVLEYTLPQELGQAAGSKSVKYQVLLA
jgi:hypothetical protein